jgi:hypothetical protein
VGRAGREPATRTSSFPDWWFGRWDHVVSILIATVGAVGRYRGALPQSKVLMMIMRPPHQEQGCSGAFGSSGLVVAALMASIALVAGEQAIVAIAVQAFWQHVHQEAADELVGGERHDFVALACSPSLEGDAIVIAALKSLSY